MDNPSLFYLILKHKIQHPECFRPTRHFYRETGIGQRRYGLLYRGDRPPTEKEIQNLCDYIGCTNYELFLARQLQIPFNP